ncbi:hypothetical protein OEZ86_012036 [Tetradesmus obliquus]|uniref:Uncharacterized protein n=2 Tax=Tetradesmus obliquus TaxID=3088 RepID=A0A383W9T0_TETOB|nr:hypothetical protein OEZ85_008856 [Tetradesmus obliquus]WIA29539.1 hypothetical protein OEZ86_012036 [Tetradesmus obliquus]|eukprot:jgi/Sobl393_1/18485/SZX73942.1
MPRLQSKFCRMCGGSMAIIQPEGDKEWRHVCNSCGYIDYFNPRMVVGCVVEHEGKILLCKRAIEPCRGLWTIPAGFMEIGESSAAGAERETYEEAHARVQVLSQYAHWDIPVIGQAYILFRAKLASPFTFSSGPESLEVALFDPASIPFDQIAFSSISITLRHYLQDMASGQWHLHHGVIDKVPGAAPNDPASFQLKDHFSMPVTLSQQ